MFSFFRKDDCEKYYKFGQNARLGLARPSSSRRARLDNEKWAVKIINKRALGPDDTEALQTEVDIAASR